MESVVILAVLALVFDATHIALATGRTRAALVAALGERGFLVLYSTVASVLYAAVVAYYAAHRFDGPPGLALGATAWRWPLIVVIVVGVALFVAGLLAYPALPTALFGPIRTPRGIDRITRHPFFMGIALVFAAHTLLATRLIGAVFSLGVVVLATFGPLHQDRKLQARHGDGYARYRDTTSLVPFAAIIAGKQRLVWSELPLGALAGGVALAVVLRLVHASLFAAGGLWLIVAVIGGAGVAGAVAGAFARARRTASRAVGQRDARGPALRGQVP